MKVDEITEGFWDVMAGAVNPMSRKNMIGSQKKDPATGQPMIDASGNPVYNTAADYAADYAASKERPSVADYEAQYRQQYLGQADAIEKGVLAPDHVSSVTRKGIDQTRREANMPPVDWAKIDAAHAAEKAKKSTPAGRGFKVYVPKSKTPPPPPPVPDTPPPPPPVPDTPPPPPPPIPDPPIKTGGKTFMPGHPAYEGLKKSLMKAGHWPP
jgi:hypothetical protein